jgi:hypothetical protein
MMSTHSGRMRRLLPALVALLGLAAFAVPVAPAGAEETVEPAWIGYAVTADFNGAQPRIDYTVFGGVNGPPAQVYDFHREEITDGCVFTDITYSGGYAQFNGTSSKIECELPSFADTVAELFPNMNPLETKLTCPCGGAPFWASAQFILDPVSGEQPVINVLAPNDDGIFFRLSGNGITSRSVINLTDAPPLTSPQWNVSSSGNRTLLGINGPSIIALDDAFGWLSYLNPAWEAAFETVVGANSRHWYESPNQVRNVPAPAVYKLYTTDQTATIGHNPVSGAYFDGRLRYVRIDPGCNGL